MNPTPGASYDIEFTHQSDQIAVRPGGFAVVETAAGNVTTQPVEDKVSVAFPFTATFPSNHVSGVYCSCGPTCGCSPSQGTWGTLCTTACKKVTAGFAAHDIEAVCTSIEVKLRVNRARFSVGLMPTEFAVPGGKTQDPHWTRDFFSGAKDFHLDRMFDLAVTGIPALPFVAGDGDVPGASTNTVVDVGVGADATCFPAVNGIPIPSSPDICGDSKCDQPVAEGIAQQVGATLNGEFAKTVATQFYKRLLYNPSQFPPPLPAGVSFTPCNLSNSGCQELDGSQIPAPASVTYQLWDWFAGPFGPIDYPAPPGTQVKFLPVTTVEHHLVAPVPNPSYVAPAIVLKFAVDPDSDGVPTPTTTARSCGIRTSTTPTATASATLATAARAVRARPTHGQSRGPA